MAGTRYDAGALQREAVSAANGDSQRRFGKRATRIGWEVEIQQGAGNASAVRMRLVVNYTVRGEAGDVAAVTVAL